MKNIIKTERLLLRPWQERDLLPFAAMNADPCVREFFPGLLNREESDNSVIRFSEHIEKHGWGFWSASLLQTGEFIGFIGLSTIGFKAHFNLNPTVEIGWRLAQEYWGKGYATEGALASLRYGFEEVQLDEIVALTAVHNIRSRNVMEKIGMHWDALDDFDHPNVPEGNPVRRHVLYRIQQTEWHQRDA